MSRRAAIVLALSLAGLSLTACATAGSAPTSVSEEGRWTGEGPEEITLRSGEVSGTDGCNGLSGTYTVNGSDVVVTLGLSTMMACFGVDTWLRGIVTATISDDMMTVFDRDGAQIGILTRAA